MTYQEAINLIMVNTFNLSQVPTELVDVRLMRFVRKRNIWAADAYCPKGLKKEWLNIILDKVVKLETPDILEDGTVPPEKEYGE